MNLTFEWDSEKAETNCRKHGVSFEEAVSVFAELSSFTIPDPVHSHGEPRYLLLGWGYPTSDVCWSCPIRNEVRPFESSTRGGQAVARRECMKKVKTEVREPEMRAEYDFRGGVRGKYAARFARGTNIVILEPDVAARFPDAKAVNDALRALAAVADRKARPRSGRRQATKSIRGLTAGT